MQLGRLRRLGGGQGALVLSECGGWSVQPVNRVPQASESLDGVAHRPRSWRSLGRMERHQRDPIRMRPCPHGFVPTR